MKLFAAPFALHWILIANFWGVLTIHSCEEQESSSSKAVNDSEPNESWRSTDQWERALKEIKNLAVSRSNIRTNETTRDVSLFRRWRSLLDEPTNVEIDPKINTTTATVEHNDNRTFVSLQTSERDTARFDGFVSWERTLQDWTDDVQDYIEKIESENKGYPMSQYGNSARNQPYLSNDSRVEDNESKIKRIEKELKQIHIPKKDSIRLPVPARKEEDEDAVPYTDLSDKSKNILIVTTASLPWMTGTAVNPLLRAAYMTDGRKKRGGSVTLMLPWLERKQDQEDVYGSKHIFENKESQEAYIREWLRKSACLPKASDELNLQWYTAWQNKAENSVYSMGDITALISEDEVDICILEEPEHLNWYRAPGDSWTDKFKHVVGIIHTNYFVYAQDQPAAFVRVSILFFYKCAKLRPHAEKVFAVITHSHFPTL